MKEAEVAVQALQTQAHNTKPSFTSTTGQQHAQKNIMDFKAITNFEKLTNDATSYSIWVLRLKTAFKIVGGNSGEVNRIVGNLEKATVIHVSRKKDQFQEVIRSSICDTAQINKMSTEFYTVLIDRCTDNQMITFENEAADVFTFNQVNQLMTRTAGIGGLQRRGYTDNLTVATKESEVYGLIIGKK